MDSAPPITDRSFKFAIRIVKLAQHLEKSPGVPRTLSNQLLRSGTSIGANVEEAQGSQSRPDFLTKMSIALKEARETLYWLRLLQAAELCSESQLADLIKEANELVSILVAIVKNTKAKSELRRRKSE